MCLAFLHQCCPQDYLLHLNPRHIVYVVLDLLSHCWNSLHVIFWSLLSCTWVSQYQDQTCLGIHYDFPLLRSFKTINCLRCVDIFCVLSLAKSNFICYASMTFFLVPFCVPIDLFCYCCEQWQFIVVFLELIDSPLFVWFKMGVFPVPFCFCFNIYFRFLS